MIGAFRHVMTLLVPVETPDEAGGASVAYAPIASFWASARQIAAAETGDGVRRRRLRVNARWRNDFALGARLSFDGADYDIVSIESDDGKGRRVFLVAEEVA